MQAAPKTRSIAFLLLLGSALLCQLSGFDPLPSPLEKRSPAARPEFPRSLAQLRTYPEGLKNWHNDHFGLRNSLLLARHSIEVFLLRSSPNPNVVMGSGSRLFLFRTLFPGGFEELRPFSDEELLQFASHLEDRAAAFRQRKLAYVFLVCPDSAAFHADSLPSWAAQRGISKRRQQLAAFLRARGKVEMPDLDPALETARQGGEIYFQHDSHWNERGALAAYGELMRALQRQAAACGLPQDCLRPLEQASFDVVEVPRKGGDLANMMGLDGAFMEAQPLYRPHGMERLEFDWPPSRDYRWENPRAACGLKMSAYKDSYFVALARFIGLHFKQMDLREDWDLDMEGALREQGHVVLQQLVGRHLDKYFEVMVQPWPVQGSAAPSLKGKRVQELYATLSPDASVGSFDSCRLVANQEWSRYPLVEMRGRAGAPRPGGELKGILLTDREGKILGAGRVAPAGSKWKAWLMARDLGPGPVQAYALLADGGLGWMGEQLPTYGR